MRQLVLVTDLDNTLYDWVGFYVPAFRAMAEQLAVDTQIPIDILLENFRVVHQRHGTVEYSFSIEELPILRERFPAGVPRELVTNAAERFRAVKRDKLRLYPEVAETLARLVRGGVRVVAYTEANAYQALERIIGLGVSRYMSAVYATEDHAVPEGRKRSNIGSRLGKPIHRIPNELRKPDPAVLRIIAGNLGVDVGDLLYIGDSLAKDVAMAQRAGAVDVWASYGARHGRDDYALLVSISHWTPEMVERERSLSARQIAPTHSIDGFAAIESLVETLATR